MKHSEAEARRWMAQAMDDFQFVQWLDEESRFFDKGCFIAQQAGEKALKACLYAEGRRFVTGHSLFEMAQTLSGVAAEFKHIDDACKRLDRYYIPTRYPNGLPGGSPYQVYDAAELRAALADLQKVLQLAGTYLRSKSIVLNNGET